MSTGPWDVRQGLRTQRQRAKLSLAKLADRTGLSKTYLVRLESDPAANPSLDVLGRLAEAFDVTIAELLDQPALQFDLNEAKIPNSLKRYAADDQIGPREVKTLASIRWRHGEEPQTPARWRYIHQQLKLSRQIDEEEQD
jgi:transcriptional regulator with XRE-family HTH domain